MAAIPKRDARKERQRQFNGQTQKEEKLKKLNRFWMN